MFAMSDDQSDETTPAAYPETDEDEQITIQILEQCFGDEIKSHIDSRDKVPNHDGHIEIVDSDGSPLGRIVVQVKKLPEGNIEPPRKQIKTKHLAYCRAVIEPFILILVDTEEEVGYWKHITRDWFKNEGLDSQESKVVRTDKQNCIKVDDQKYKSDWAGIIEKTKRKVEDYEKLRELKERSNSAIGKEKEEFERIHEFLDEYHGLLESDFESLKEQRFPNVWKFGFGSIEYSQNSLHYTLYPIYASENDAQIREINPSWEEIENLGASKRRGIPHDNPIHRKPEDFAYDVIRNQVEDQIRDRDLDLSENHFSAMEYVYPFVDKYSELLGLEDQEEYSVEAVREGYYRFLQFWLTEAMSDILRDHNIGEVGTSIQGYLKSDLGERGERLHRTASVKTQEADSDPPRHRIHGPDFDQALLEKLIDSLVESPLETLEKPFQEEDLDRESVDSVDGIWDLYSNETLFQNALTYYTEFPKEYQNVVSQNFPSTEEELKYPPTNFLVVMVNPSNMKGGIGGGWSTKRYWLKSDYDDLRVEVHREEDDEIPDEINDPFESFEYDGVEYTAARYSSGGAFEMSDAIRGRSSLIDEVLDKVESEIDTCLREKAPTIQHPKIQREG